MFILFYLSPQMFDNIAKLRFDQGSSGEPLANAMISGEGEMMEYRQGVVAEGKVEDWMTQVRMYSVYIIIGRILGWLVVD